MFATENPTERFFSRLARADHDLDHLDHLEGHLP